MSIYPDNAITGHFAGRQRELRCDVVIQPFTGDDARKVPSCVCSGIWDTGATNSAIDESVVDKLSLKPVNQVETSTANDMRISNVYLVQITILNRITKIINVTEANLNGAEMLIGMDVIGDGDFAISTDLKSGDMYLSYQVPSQGKIDFIERSNQHKKQARAALRKKNRKKKK